MLNTSMKIKCTECNKKFSKKGLGSHMWRTHGLGKTHNPAKLRKRLDSTIDCQYCDRNINTRNIKRHEDACCLNPTNIRRCQLCENILTSWDQTKFCNHSCALTYRNLNTAKSIVNKRKYYCTYCNKELSHKRKYCDHACKNEHIFETKHIPLILAGKKTAESKNTLRKFIINQDGETCSKCGLGAEWDNEPLVLQLDHIDGNSDNNFPNNLRLLCPNCHTQTPTWGSKGNGSRYKKITKRNGYLRDYKIKPV